MTITYTVSNECTIDQMPNSSFSDDKQSCYSLHPPQQSPRLVKLTPST